jgi:hypothetical protein
MDHTKKYRQTLKVEGMAESMHKPRRTRGTVAYNARRYFGWGVLVVGAACGLIFQYENFYNYGYIFLVNFSN